MSDHQTTVVESTTETDTASDKHGTLVDFVFDLGTEWAAHGLDTGRHALELSARTLEKVASTLEAVRKQLIAKP